MSVEGQFMHSDKTKESFNAWANRDDLYTNRDDLFGGRLDYIIHHYHNDEIVGESAPLVVSE